MEKFDVAVIGAGPGGYPAAIRAAQLGASTAVVEKEELGGTCLNWGCIPTKALIAGAGLFARMQSADDMGVAADAVSFDYAAMSRRKDRVVATLRSGVAALLKANGVRVFRGTARFLDRNTLTVAAEEGDTTVSAANTVIATGSESVLPAFLPRSPRVVESRAFLGLTGLPDSLIVLGGGVIGCEYACMAAQLGTAVTVVELLPDILAGVEAEVRATLRRHMEDRLGIRIYTGAPLADVRAAADRVTGRAGDTTVEAQLLLVAVGRRPVTRGLDLASAGVRIGESGFIEVDAFGRTTAPTVYAVGDVTEGIQLAHAATSQGLGAAENILTHPRRPLETLIPSCIFTTPEIGSVGLTEEQAAQNGRDIATGRFPFSSLGKALAAGETDGFVKWVADAGTGQLLGAHAVGAHATDLIAEATLAVRAELTGDELGRTVHCHPTFSESWMEAAHAVHGQCIHAAPKKR